MQVKVHLDYFRFNQKPHKEDTEGITVRIPFRTKYMNPETILEKLSEGYSILPSTMIDFVRTSQDFEQQQLLLLDFDNDLSEWYQTMEEVRDMTFTQMYASFMYKSFSFKEDHHKFRLGFVLDEPLTDKQDVKKAYKYLLQQYPTADTACLEPARLFFGGRDGFMISKNNLLPKSIAQLVEDEQQTTRKQVKPNQKVDNSKDAYTKVRELDMADFLYSQGYEVAGVGQAFSCIFDEHDDDNPSALIYTNWYGEHRYFCHSHKGGKISLSLIDLWAELNNMKNEDAHKDILNIMGIEYEESEFVKDQKEKYFFNSTVIEDLSYIKTNFPRLHTYLNRYQLELDALLMYAQGNLYGDKYSHNNEAIFSISTRYITKIFVEAKDTGNVDHKRYQSIVKLFCTLGIIERIPENELTDHAISKSNQLMFDNGYQIYTNRISFYKFNKLTDMQLSKANNRAEQLKNNNFKINNMTKDYLISVFGQYEADRVFPDDRSQVSESFNQYKTAFSKDIMNLLNSNGYTTRKEVLEDVNLNVSHETKRKQFDKVINDICDSYGLKFVSANKDIRSKLGITGKGRKKVIIPDNI